jgi:hypothetical protein
MNHRTNRIRTTTQTTMGENEDEDYEEAKQYSALCDPQPNQIST